MLMRVHSLALGSAAIGFPALGMLWLVACGSPPGDAPPVDTQPVDTEAISLLGRPLPAPDLDPEFRARQEALLAEAEDDLAASPEDPEALIWVGRRTAYLGRYRDAIALYTRGLEAHPDHPGLLRHRGHRLITLRRLEEAILDLDRAGALIAGTADIVEPDGLPNARNIPTSTLHSNVWYHLGLAHTLRGDFELALAAYESCLKVSANPDMLSATSHWLFMTLRRLGRDERAEEVLKPITADMDIIENRDYHRLLMMYQGREDPATLLADAEEAGGVAFATVGYGVGNWYLTGGEAERAEEIFARVIASESWAAFGFIAAEAELARLRSP